MATKLSELSPEAKDLCRAITAYIQEQGRWEGGVASDSHTLRSAASDVMDSHYRYGDPVELSLVKAGLIERHRDTDGYGRVIHKTWELTDRGKRLLDPRAKLARKRRASETVGQVEAAVALGKAEAEKTRWI